MPKMQGQIYVLLGLIQLLYSMLFCFFLFALNIYIVILADI